MHGLIDWFGLERVHWWVTQENPEANLAEIQCKTLDLVRSLTRDGLVQLGELTEVTCLFSPWDIPTDEAMQKIREPYLSRFDDDTAWWFVCWLNLTERGRREAETLEAKRDLSR